MDRTGIRRLLRFPWRRAARRRSLNQGIRDHIRHTSLPLILEEDVAASTELSKDQSTAVRMNSAESNHFLGRVRSLESLSLAGSPVFGVLEIEDLMADRTNNPISDLPTFRRSEHKEKQTVNGPLCVVCREIGTEENILTQICKSCWWCRGCLQTVFQNAISSPQAMPPKCCNIIPLHYGLSFLTAVEAAKFRLLFEEWATPGNSKLYCPRPSCGAFVPLRAMGVFVEQKSEDLDHDQTGDKGKDVRRDSARESPSETVITSLPRSVSCLECGTYICLTCKSFDHSSEETCSGVVLVDDKLWTLLSKWGYKPCPRCKNAVRKMHGCSHMECVCGEHFCWTCARPLRDCDGTGGCGDNDDEGEEEDYQMYYDDEELYDAGCVDDRIEREEQGGRAGGAGAECTVDSVEDDGLSAIANAAREIFGVGSSEYGPDGRRRLLNLDGGGTVIWEDRGDYFGAEPGDDIVHSRVWAHVHCWDKVSATFLYASDGEEIDVECHICWAAPRVKRNSGITGGDVAGELTDPGRWQCQYCKLVACERCQTIQI